jgi:hypothetical protein
MLHGDSTRCDNWPNLRFWISLVLTIAWSGSCLAQEPGPAPTTSTASQPDIAEQALPGLGPAPLVEVRVFSQDLLPAGDSRKAAFLEARVYLSFFDVEGRRFWQTQVPRGPEGDYLVLKEHLPDLPQSVRGLVSAEADGYLAAGTPLSWTRQGDRLVAAPQQVVLELRPVNRWLTIYLLMPAGLCVLLAIRHLIHPGRGTAPSLGYTLWIGACWVVVVLLYAFVHRFSGDLLIPLFWPDVLVPSGVVVFAFLGTLTYVAFSIYDKREGFFTATVQRSPVDKYFRTLGGRILVAPYVAVVGHVMLSTVFPALEFGPAALFLAFFTGLWIKVVLNLLNDIGGRFLSAEAAKKAADRLAREEAPEASDRPTGDARALLPAPAFFDAVRRARRQLFDKTGVVGVGLGTKNSSCTGGTDEHAIVVYVYQKKELPANDPDRVPTVIDGVSTDVVEISLPADDQSCHTAALGYFWDKIYRDHQRSIGATRAPASIHVETVKEGGDGSAGVVVLTAADASSTFFPFSLSRPEEQQFVPRSAYDLVRPYLGDYYDFVTFVLDLDSGVTPQGAYYVAVHNDVAGINFYKDPGPQELFSERSEWNSVRLLGCPVHGKGRGHLTPEALLHELGHAWSAYVTFAGGGMSGRLDLLLQKGSGAGYHWSDDFDNGISCMDYDKKRWVWVRDDVYRQEQVPPTELGYCDLDLYLMGFKSRHEVAPLRILKNKKPAEDPAEVHAVIETVDVQDIIDDVGGERRNASGITPTTFRQAFVVVTREVDSGCSLAVELNELRKMHEENFHRKTGARVETDLVV